MECCETPMFCLYLGMLGGHEGEGCDVPGENVLRQAGVIVWAMMSQRNLPYEIG